MDCKIVRGPSGFGDAIYLKAALDICFGTGANITVLNNFPEVLVGYETIPYTNGTQVDYDFSYVLRKKKKDTNQFEDMLIQSGLFTIAEAKKCEFDLRFTYNPAASVKDPKDYVDRNPTMITIPPYGGFGNGQGVNAYMTPDQYGYEKLLTQYRKDYDVITINEKKPFSELVSLFTNSDKVYCQQGWGTALAEGLGIPCDVIFTKKALNSKNKFLETITPEKIFTKKTSKAIIL